MFCVFVFKTSKKKTKYKNQKRYQTRPTGLPYFLYPEGSSPFRIAYANAHEDQKKKKRNPKKENTKRKREEKTERHKEEEKLITVELELEKSEAGIMLTTALLKTGRFF